MGAAFESKCADGGIHCWFFLKHGEHPSYFWQKCSRCGLVIKRKIESAIKLN